MAKAKATKWACPQCGAGAGEHGKGGRATCIQHYDTCEGLLCECLDDDRYNTKAEQDDHGHTQENPCRSANCYHCGWGGTIPPPLYDVKKLKGWAKTAWAAGWRPPAGWTP